jgi:hypothetical protein
MIYLRLGGDVHENFKINGSLFFDSLLTSFDAIIKILESNNIDDILTVDNIIVESVCSNIVSIFIISLEILLIIHDFMYNNIHSFIYEYKQRFNYMIQQIKSNNKIIFIRFSNYIINDTTIEKFKKTILKINNKCNVILLVFDKNIEHSITYI